MLIFCFCNLFIINALKIAIFEVFAVFEFSLCFVVNFWQLFHPPFVWFFDPLTATKLQLAEAFATARFRSKSDHDRIRFAATIIVAVRSD